MCGPVAHRTSAGDSTLTVGAGHAEEHWVYRRDPTVTRPWEEAVLHTPETGIPYLAPDLQLLFKSKDHRPKDDEDATTGDPGTERVRRGTSCWRTSPPNTLGENSSNSYLMNASWLKVEGKYRALDSAANSATALLTPSACESCVMRIPPGTIRGQKNCKLASVLA